MLSIVQPVTEYPVPYEQSEIDDIWNDSDIVMGDGDAPIVDEAHEEYIDIITRQDDWLVFRVRYPFGYYNNVYFWNSSFGSGFRIDDDEGSWHSLVNLFADIVDEEGDCREASYSSSITPSGSYDQRCDNCGESWSVG